MNNSPLVSIIIPTFNRSHLIGETLDSVLAQTYQNWECIIVDDGSSDNTDEVVGDYVKKDPRFKYYHRPDTHKPGGNGARNYGFEVSEGEYVQWFDSDDLMKTNCIQERLKAFNGNTQFVISGGAFLIQNVEIDTFNVEIINNLYKDYVLWKAVIFTPSILFKKEFILKSDKLFNESILKGQETDFLGTLFFKNANANYNIINQVHFLYRRHAKTKSSLNLKYISDFKMSIAHNHLSNLERGLVLNDEKLVRYFYKKSLKLYYQALKNNDKKTAQFIFESFQQYLIPKNLLLLYKVKCLKIIMKFNNKLSSIFFNHLKYYSIKF